MVTHNGPNIGAQHHQANFSALKALLIHNILVCGYYNFKAGSFCRFEKFAIADTCPAAVVNRFRLDGRLGSGECHKARSYQTGRASAWCLST
jgi:hypothetical protein